MYSIEQALVITEVSKKYQYQIAGPQRELKLFELTTSDSPLPSKFDTS